MGLKGGNKLSQVLAQIGQSVSKGERVKVGFLSGATYPDTPRGALRATYTQRKSQGQTRAIAGSSGGKPVAMIAAFQEFGTGTIPPRPFFRNMIRNKSHEWGPALGTDLVATHYNVGLSLDRLGAGIAGQLKQSIVDTNTPPLAASTIAQKGFSKPLISTAHMIMSVDHKVI